MLKVVIAAIIYPLVMAAGFVAGFYICIKIVSM